jgi:hypothetical protein
MRRALELFGLTTVYERHQKNVGFRDNYVYAFSRRQLQLILNSYYLDSNYRAELQYGWYSSRFNALASPFVRQLSGYAGWAMQYIPGSPGNIVTAIIQPGTDLPADVAPIGRTTPIQ